jgi:hypothetical protein
MFAPPVKAPKAKTASPSVPTRAPQPPEHRLGSRVGGMSNRAMLRYRSQSAESLTSHKSGGLSQQEAQHALGTSLGAAPSKAWDFSKVPALAPDRTSQSQTSPPLVQLKLRVGQANDPLEQEADQVEHSVATAVTPFHNLGLVGQGSAASGGQLPSSLRGRLEAFLGWDLGAVRIHTGDAAWREARTLSARAFTRGSDVYFGPGSFRPETRAGIGLLGHELVHVHQQSVGRVPWGEVQKKEDWDFTPTEYQTLLKGKKDLRFDADSAWMPKALQDNLLTTLKFALTSTKPVRTAGINVKDFYHAHFVIPKKMPAGLSKRRTEFEAKSEKLQAKALGGDWFDPVTESNLAAYTKAMQETEKLANPLLKDALKIKGAAVLYHTFESSGPQMKPGSPTRNILTPIGGTPSGYDPSGKEADANQYLDNYSPVLQFAFLVDETGVIHATTGTIQNLSRVTGIPMGS